MNTNIFINEAMDFSIREYIKYKEVLNENDSFYINVIKTLIFIYGELDILNPYQIKNEKNFEENLKKFDLSETIVNDFIEHFQNFYKNSDNTLAKQDFIAIQKDLIDMFMKKKSHVLISDTETTEFQNLLYTRNNVNPSKLALYTKYSPNNDEVLEYFNNELFELNHQYVFREFQDLLLSGEAYQLAGFNPPEVQNMKPNEIENINNKVYHFFNIKNNDKNKKQRVRDAVEYYKKFGPIVTARNNGYVNLLLVMAMLATGFMLLIIIGVNIFR